MNLGLGSDESLLFNISLAPAFNQTGNGTFCFPKLELPAGLDVAEGTNASIQVIQLGELGSALYNVRISLFFFPLISFNMYRGQVTNLAVFVTVCRYHILGFRETAVFRQVQKHDKY